MGKRDDDGHVWGLESVRLGKVDPLDEIFGLWQCDGVGQALSCNGDVVHCPIDHALEHGGSLRHHSLEIDLKAFNMVSM